MRRWLPCCALLVLACLAVPACGDDDDGDPEGSAGSAAGMDAGAGGGAGPSDGGVPQAIVCEVQAPRACSVDPKPKFADVMPILAERCLSCHDGTGEQWPLLSYSHVALWNNQIRESMLHCTMPPSDAGIDMPTEEREALLMWIDCGFEP